MASRPTLLQRQPRKAWVLMLLLPAWTACQDLRNSYDRFVMDCGEDREDGASYFKVYAASGAELRAEALSVMRWRDGELSPVLATSKGCVKQPDPERETLIVREIASGAAAMVDKDALLQEPRIQVQPIEEAQLPVACQDQDVNQLTDLGSWADRPSARLAAYQLSISVKAGDGARHGTSTRLVTQSSHAGSYQLQDFGLADGRYELEYQWQNLLRDTKSQTLRCPVLLDSHAPVVQIKIPDEKNWVDMFFARLDAGSDLAPYVQSESPAEILSCWVPMAEHSSTLDLLEKSCDPLAGSPRLQVPTSGFWLLQVQGRDAAGNLSTKQSLPIFAYNRETISRIRLLTESIPFEVDKRNNPQLGVLKALEAETLKRNLKTETERQEAEKYTRDGLYQILHKNIPLKEIKHGQPLLTVTARPDNQQLVVVTIKSGTVIAYDTQGKVQWKDELGELPADVAYSASSQYLAVSGATGLVVVWDAKLGTRISQNNKLASGRITELHFDPLSQILLGRNPQGQLFYWNLADELGPRLIGAQAEPIAGFSWTPDGAGFVLARGHNLYRFNRQGEMQGEPFPYAVVGGRVQAVSYLDQKHLMILSIPKAMPLTIADYTTTVAIVDENFQVLRSENLEILNPSPNGAVTREQIQMPDRISVSPDRQNVAVYGENYSGIYVLYQWDLALQPERTISMSAVALRKLTAGFNALSWFADSARILAYGSRSEVVAYNRVGEIIFQIQKDDRNFAGADAALLDQANLIVAGNSVGTVYFWPIEPKIFPSYYSPDGWINHVSRSPSGDYRLTVEYNPVNALQVKVFDANFNLLQSWPFPRMEAIIRYGRADIKSFLRSVSFYDEKSILVADMDGTIYLKDLAGTDLQAPVRIGLSDRTPLPDKETLTSFAVSEDRKRLLLGYATGEVILVEAPSFKILERRKVHGQAAILLLNGLLSDSAVVKIQYDRVNKRFLSSGLDGRIIAWDENMNDQVLFTSATMNDGFSLSPANEILVAPLFETRMKVFDQGGQLVKLVGNGRRSLPLVAGDSRGQFYAGAEGRSSQFSMVYLWDQKGELIHEFDYGFPAAAEYLEFDTAHNNLEFAGYNRLLSVPLSTTAIYDRYCALYRETAQAYDEDGIGICREAVP